LGARPVGVLVMEDEAGQDEKILGVPADVFHPFYLNISNYTDLRTVLLDQIAHFFGSYKDLEVYKWVNIVCWGDADDAVGMIKNFLVKDAYTS